MKTTEHIAEQVTSMIPVIRRRLMSNVFKNIQIPPAQIFVILHLSEFGSCNLRHICKELAVSAPTITGIVDRLEKALYVERRPDKNDRRVTNVVLTSKGKTLSLKLKEEMKNQIMKVLKTLPQEDQEKYLEIIRKIYEAV